MLKTQATQLTNTAKFAKQSYSFTLQRLGIADPLLTSVSDCPAPCESKAALVQTPIAATAFRLCSGVTSR